MRSLSAAVFLLAGCGTSTGLPAADDMAASPWPAHCSNGVRDADETDVDCGGGCAGCAADRGCRGMSDCTSAVCVNKLCAAPSCSDGVPNGGEADVDCGGPCPARCAEGHACADGTDCQSARCVNNRCTGAPVDMSSLDGPVDALPPPDMAIEDGGPPPPCVADCINNVETTCVQGVAMKRKCSFGCAHPFCAIPTTCAAPGDISAAAIYQSSTANVLDNNQGSCAIGGGQDNALSFKLARWSDVTLTVKPVGNPWSAALYTRSNCFAAQSELAMGGPCAATAPVPACSANAGTITQKLCGLSPGTYYSFVDGQTARDSGDYTIETAFAADDLNSCTGSGRALSGVPIKGDTSIGHADQNRAPNGTANCGDLGVGSPEYVFFVVVRGGAMSLQAKVVSTDPMMKYQPLVYLAPACPVMATANQTQCGVAANNTATTPLVNNPAAGTWFVVVDGTNNTSGPFTLTVTIN